MRGRGSRQNLVRLVASEDGASAAPPEAHAPAPTAATKATRASATTVTVRVGEPLTAWRLCAWRGPQKSGVYLSITSLIKLN